jgi:hypothetical protein
VIEYEGSRWQLTVYPNGSPGNSNYLSIFVELLSNPDALNSYSIQMEVAHPLDPKRNIGKEHQGSFEFKETWGFGKFAKIDDLSQGGYMEEDCLEIRLGIRLNYYFDLYKRREVLLAGLDS